MDRNERSTYHERVLLSRKIWMAVAGMGFVSITVMQWPLKLKRYSGHTIATPSRRGSYPTKVSALLALTNTRNIYIVTACMRDADNSQG